MLIDIDADTSIDKGHWSVTRSVTSYDSDGTLRYLLSSTDFNCDVQLEIKGDFPNDEVKLEYAKHLAERLNSTRPKQD